MVRDLGLNTERQQGYRHPHGGGKGGRQDWGRTSR